MRFYYVSVQCTYGHTMAQYADALGPFWTEQQARDTWKVYEAQVKVLGPTATLKSVEIDVEELIMILLRENFLAFQEVVRKSKTEDIALL